MKKAGRVGIIGAGIGGLTVGRNLTAAGLIVEIFDKGRGPGGRVSSKRTQFGSLDFGAQVLPCKSDLFKLQIEKWAKEGIIVPHKSRKILKNPGIFEDEAEAERNIEKFMPKPKMSAIAVSLASGLNIKYEKLIDRVQKNEEKETWDLFTQDGTSVGEFDWLIVNCPPLQALKFLENTKIQEKVKEVNMQPCWAVSLTFPESLGIPLTDAKVECSEIINYISNNSSRPDRVTIPETWVLHGTPAWSQEHLEDPLESVGFALENEFFKILNISTRVPLNRIVHRWRFSKVDNPLSGEGYLLDESSKVAVCADWCHGTFVEDAYLSATKLSDYFISRSSL